jgi:hypothetical protein
MSRYDRWSHDGAPQGEELARIQRGIDQTIRAIAADRYNPTALPRAPTVTVVGAPTVGERPLTSPMPNGSFIEGVIGGMIDHALGPALPQEAMRARLRAQIRALSPEQRAALLRGIEGEPHAKELWALIEAAQP